MLELAITSLYLIVEFKVHPSTPMMTNDNDCFPNYSKMKQPIGKGRVPGSGREGELSLRIENG
jgi:hypothetical protein